MIKENKGITLIALSITVILLMIIAGVSMYEGVNIISDVRANKQKTELEMVQHAILEKYTSYKLTRNEDILIGEHCEYYYVIQKINTINENKSEKFIEKIELKQEDYSSNPNPDDFYYELSIEQLEQLGITKSTDKYIVNYKTGEVINSTQLVTNKGEPLYIYATE